LRRFKRDNETPLKTRQFFTRWRFQTRIKRVFIRRFLKPGREFTKIATVDEENINKRENASKKIFIYK
jgi:hypothetical protein